MTALYISRITAAIPRHKMCLALAVGCAFLFFMTGVFACAILSASSLKVLFFFMPAMSKTRSSHSRRAAQPEPETPPMHTCPPGTTCTHSSHGTMHVARGVVSVWMAAVLVVLSFAMLATLSSNAYAQSLAPSNDSASQTALLRQMNVRMERMERVLERMDTATAIVPVVETQ